MKAAGTAIFLMAFAVTLAQADGRQKWMICSKKQYTIQAPADWLADSSRQMGTDLVLFSLPENSTDRFRDNVTVLIQQLPNTEVNLGNYTAFSLAQLKKTSPDARIEKSETITTGKATYQNIIYTATQYGLPLKVEQYYYLTGRSAYTISLTTEAGKFELFRPIGERILHSFQLR